MRTHAALLRGINVVGRNKVSMPELREVVAALGFSDVATYIQSGNVVFGERRAGEPSAEIADAIERAVTTTLGVAPAAVVVTRGDLRRVVERNPFPRVEDHRLLHAVFLRDEPDREGVASVAAAVERAAARQSRDDARVVGRALYLWTPDGFARSVLRAELDRGGRLRTPMHAGTARNWATVTKLLTLLEP